MSFIFTLFLLVADLGIGEDIRLEMDFTYDTLVECELELGQLKQSLEAGWYGEQILEWTVTPCTIESVLSPVPV